MDIRTLKSQQFFVQELAGNCSDFWPAMETRNCSRQNRSIPSPSNPCVSVSDPEDTFLTN